MRKIIKDTDKSDREGRDYSAYPYLKGLNPEQLEAVLHTEGPLLILAGAGSGKTRVITLRALHLVKAGLARPSSILGVTFTNKAAGEMKERIARALEVPDKDDRSGLLPDFSTFHSFCLRVLRKHADLLGYGRSFAVFDEDDSGKVISRVIKSLNLDEKIFTASKAKYFIENNKNSFVDHEQSLEKYNNPWEKNFSLIYEEYSKRLKQNDAMDFGDLLFNAVRLFETNADLLEIYSSHYQYVMVDEFQDTNFIQDRLTKLLVGGHKNICVVGDDDQSIYSFRGALVDNILKFEESFPGCRVIKLERNYRSTRTILNAASNLVRENKFRKDKTLKTEKAGGGPVTVYRAESDYSEAYYITREIRRLTRLEGYSNKDIAVLYRVNSISRIIEDRLVKESVKYQVYGGLKFYQRKEIKDIISFLRFAANPKDAVSFERSISCVPIGAGEATVKKIRDIADKNGSDILSAYGSGLLNGIKGLKETVSPVTKPAPGLLNYFGLIMELRRKIDARPTERGSLSALISMIYVNSGYESMLNGGRKTRALNSEADESRIENIEELINASQEFDDIAEFLDQSAIDESSAKGQGGDFGDISKVSLMTLHSAKGLEFPVVFMVGLEEQLFPHARSLFEESSVEEERRLCYVGITRARERLYLTYSRKRKMGKEFRYNHPSRFINEIPDSLKEVIEDDYSYSWDEGSRYYR